MRLIAQVLAGKYRVEGALGEGGFGVVLAATHLHLGERVAIKLLRPELARDQGIVTRFLQWRRVPASESADITVELSRTRARNQGGRGTPRCPDSDPLCSAD